MNSGKPKISSFNDVTQYAELILALTWWREMLGIVTKPTESEKEMCLIHLKRSYSDLSIEDIRTAVQYALEGVLDVDFIAYNSFSPLYISKILNAYKLYRDEELNAIARAKMKFDAEQNKKDEPEISKLESRIKYLNYYFATIQESDNYILDFKGIAFGVFSRSEIGFDLEDFEFKATELVEKDNLKVKNPFEKMVDAEPATIEKYQKWLCMKNYIKQTPLQFISSLSEEIILGNGTE